MFLIVTGGSFIPSTHDPSHGAGHTRPVNSGKLLVLCNRSQRLLPQAAINEIVPFWNQIIDRTAGSHAADQLSGMAEWNAAIHATRALLLKLACEKCS